MNLHKQATASKINNKLVVIKSVTMRVKNPCTVISLQPTSNKESANTFPHTYAGILTHARTHTRTLARTLARTHAAYCSFYLSFSTEQGKYTEEDLCLAIRLLIPVQPHIHAHRRTHIHKQIQSRFTQSLIHPCDTASGTSAVANDPANR